MRCAGLATRPIYANRGTGILGREASFEQLAEVSVWQDKTAVTDVSELLVPAPLAGRTARARFRPGARPQPAASQLRRAPDGPRGFTPFPGRRFRAGGDHQVRCPQSMPGWRRASLCRG